VQAIKDHNSSLWAATV